MSALNAALTVIKWKKLLGVYVDARHELNSTYKLDSTRTNTLRSEEKREAPYEVSVGKIATYYANTSLRARFSILS